MCISGQQPSHIFFWGKDWLILPASWSTIAIGVQGDLAKKNATAEKYDRSTSRNQKVTEICVNQFRLLNFKVSGQPVRMRMFWSRFCYVENLFQQFYIRDLIGWGNCDCVVWTVMAHSEQSFYMITLSSIWITYFLVFRLGGFFYGPVERTQCFF